ncbi:NAD(P)H-dependent oxidoreductase [Marinicrinis sediminis]|uniref:NAD(P)H-dependent oxidoreductase n=1 Tax=Marinicrinis sediminis TaxID=1652465 RepID=A0ABW5RG39_9BACL
MNTLILYAHPNPQSFNAAIKHTLQHSLQEQGSEVRIRDLYEMRFNPILSVDDFNEYAQKSLPADVKEEQEHIAWAEQLILLYPTWWISMPAILKGYVDRVFTNGFAFRYTESGAEGLLTGKKALVFQTCGQPEQVLQQYGLIEPLRISIDTGILGFCGIETLAHEIFYEVPTITDDDRKQMLDKVKGIIQAQQSTVH